MNALWQHGAEDDALRALLREDAPHADLSTHSLGLAEQPTQVRFAARGPMVLAGVEAAARLFTLCGVSVQVQRPSASAAQAGDVLLSGHGPAAGVLLAWKTAQTLVEACSGIASATAAMVQLLRAEGWATPLACTRKNFPGTRRWAAHAVLAGGGVMHRLGLSESLLVFPEHRALLPPAQLLARLAAVRAAQPEKRLVLEVGSSEEALQLAPVADVLQLERFSPQALAELKALLLAQGWGQVRLAPAGGVNLNNALAYARAGADFLVSSAPYFAPPADVKVSITPA
jgi:molybdenum transport protein